MLKPQTVRLADVFVIGPLMVWSGAKALPANPWPGAALVVLGLSTIVYNGVNYRRARRR